MGNIKVNENLCKGCGLCVMACPMKIIGQSEGLNEKGYHPAKLINPEKCTGCCACATMCPDVAITVYREKAKERQVKK